MKHSNGTNSQKREAILTSAILVFGRYGFKKTSVEDLARSANLSKQGLYLHFADKEELFVAAIQKYLDDGLEMVQQELIRPETPLFLRLMGAMDAWFGRHLVTFTPGSFDVIEAGDRLSGSQVERYKLAFQTKLASALAESAAFQSTNNICTPEEIAQVLFLCGLTWKEGRASRAEFMQKIGLCIRACCQIEQERIKE